LLIAKAGGSSEGPENTGEAIARVAELRAPDGVELAIEVDLRLSADHEFVALHDARLERTTDGRGLVREHELRALRCLSAGPRGERVPALPEVLEAAGERCLLLDLHDDDVSAATALHRDLARLRPRQRERVCVASEHGRVIEALRALDPMLRTAATKREAWLMLGLGRLGLGRLAPRGHVWILPERHAGLRVVTGRFVERACRAGDAVWVFVVDDPADLRRLRELGVAGCITSWPARMLAELAT
jgi:glycerophosphoryl diester phosphodiesterase